MSAGRKKYTLVYRIYRRIRYLRYVKKIRKQEKQEIEKASRSEEKERSWILKRQRKADKLAEKQKRRKDRREIRESRDKLREEQQKWLLENAEEYQKVLADKKAFENRERKFRHYSRKKLLRFYLKVCRRNTTRTLKLINPANLPVLIRYIRKNRSQAKEFFIITIHSTVLFVAAYLMIFLIGLLSSAISGVFFDYKSVVYYYEILWLVKPDQWFGDSVKMIYASAPILAGILAIFMAIIFTYIRTDKSLTKLFILWGFLHGFNGFFGSLLIGSIFGRGFGYAIIWSYISDTEKVIYSIVSLTALFLLGIFTTKSFLISANSYFPKLENDKQRSFIWAQVIMPFLLGNIFLGAIMLPEILLYDMTVSLALAITIIPIAFGYRFHTSLYFEEEEIKISLKLKTLFYAFGFILVYRIILGIGIPFG